MAGAALEAEELERGLRASFLFGYVSRRDAAGAEGVRVSDKERRYVVRVKSCIGTELFDGDKGTFFLPGSLPNLRQ